MPKLGMPNVDIAFKEKGIEAVQRSQHGIEMLLLEEDSTTIETLMKEHTEGTATVAAIKNPFTLYTIDGIPASLSAENKDYITKSFIGYQKSPRRVKVYLMAKTESAEADKYTESLKAIANENWDYLAIPTIAEAQKETVGTWIKNQRDNMKNRIKVVLPAYKGDNEGIINFTNTFITTSTKKYTGAEYTPRIAGLICGTPMTISATYAPLSEVVDCDQYDPDERDEKVNNGEFFVWYDKEKFKMSRAMNSLVTNGQDKLEAYQTIKTVDVMDMMYVDIRKTAEDSYIGKYTNDYDNKCLLMSAIKGYFLELEKGRLLQKGKSTIDLDVDAIKNWRISNGKNTEEELADMSDQEIKELDTKKKVFLKASVVILDAMEDISLDVDI